VKAIGSGGEHHLLVGHRDGFAAALGLLQITIGLTL
jgi:hypothetical protein